MRFAAVCSARFFGVVVARFVVLRAQVQHHRRRPSHTHMRNMLTAGLGGGMCVAITHALARTDAQICELMKWTTTFHHQFDLPPGAACAFFRPQKHIYEHKSCGSRYKYALAPSRVCFYRWAYAPVSAISPIDYRISNYHRPNGLLLEQRTERNRVYRL